MAVLEASPPETTPAALIARARQLAGLAAADGAAARARIGTPARALSPERLARDAHKLAKSKDPAELLRAAELFTELGRGGGRDGSAYAHNCAAIFCRFDAGVRDAAMRRVLESIAATTKRPATQVPHVIAMAYYRLLDDARADAERFVRLWQAAKAHPIIKNSRGKFPVAEPAQEMLLARALDLGQLDIARELAALIRGRTKLSGALKALLARVDG